MLNLIPYNSNEGFGYERPAPEATVEIARRLNRAGVLTRLRRSAGQDVQAGCGQLRARHERDDKRRVGITMHRRVAQVDGVLGGAS